MMINICRLKPNANFNKCHQSEQYICVVVNLVLLDYRMFKESHFSTSNLTTLLLKWSFGAYFQMCDSSLAFLLCCFAGLYPDKTTDAYRDVRRATEPPGAPCGSRSPPEPFSLPPNAEPGKGGLRDELKSLDRFCGTTTSIESILRDELLVVTGFHRLGLCFAPFFSASIPLALIL